MTAAGRARLAAFAALAAASLAAAYALKHHYRDASAEELAWILAPTAWVAERATGAAFEAEQGVGFVARAHHFAIVPACAGINFMVVALLSGTLGLMRPGRAPSHNAALFAGTALAAYAATIAVNGLRIAVAFWTHARGLAVAGLSPGDLHRVQGTAIYLVALLVLYGAARRFVEGGGDA